MEPIRPVNVSKTENDDQSNSHEEESISEAVAGSSVTSDYSWNDPCSSESMNPQVTALMRANIKRLIKEKRVWWFTDNGRKYVNKRHNGLDFTLMSYNVLSQKLLEDHPYLYSHCKKEHLSWNYRSQNLLREITHHNADILCLQEVEEDHYRDVFQPHLQNYGYSSLYKKKTQGKCDGCAIFFRDKKFSLEAHVNVEYRRSDVKILNRDNVGLIALLKPRVNALENVKLCVATTHLLFNPKRGDVKLSQLRILLAEIEKLAFKAFVNNVPIYHPILLCGDMNSEPFSPLYDFIVNGNIQYDRMMSVEVSGQHKSFIPGQPMSPDALSLQGLGINFETRYDNSSSPSFPFYQSMQHFAMRKLARERERAQQKIAKDAQSISVCPTTISPAAVSSIGTTEVVPPTVITETSTLSASVVDTEVVGTTAAVTTTTVFTEAAVAVAPSISECDVTAMEMDTPTTASTIQNDNAMEVDIPVCDSNTEANVMEVDTPVTSISESFVANISESVDDNNSKSAFADTTVSTVANASAVNNTEEFAADITEASIDTTDNTVEDTSINTTERYSSINIAEREGSVSDRVEAPAIITAESKKNLAVDEAENPNNDSAEKGDPASDTAQREDPVSDSTEREDPVSDITEREDPVNDTTEREDPAIHIADRASPIDTAEDLADNPEREDFVSNTIEISTSVTADAVTTTSVGQNVCLDGKSVQPKSPALPEPSSNIPELELSGAINATTEFGGDQDMYSDAEIAQPKLLAVPESSDNLPELESNDMITPVTYSSVDQDMHCEKLLQPKFEAVPETFDGGPELVFSGSVTTTVTASDGQDVCSDAKVAKPKFVVVPKLIRSDPVVSSASGIKQEGDSDPVLQSITPGSSDQNTESGSFIHRLNLVSAYKHVRPDGRKEITTQNENSICTVDYVFYSVNNKEKFKFCTRRVRKSQVEGSLKHLGCYGLLHNPDFKDLHGLPNAYLSSDHICLISRFLLTT